MRRMTLYMAEKLSRHLKPINNIPNINNGGCGIVALTLYERLVRLGFNSRIIAIEFERKYSDDYRARKYLVKGADSSDHYVVRVDNIYFDSFGAMSYLDLCRKWGHNIVLTPIFKADLIWTLDYGGWNESFFEMNDALDYIKFIKNHLNQFQIGNNQNTNSRRKPGSHRLAFQNNNSRI